MVFIGENRGPLSAVDACPSWQGAIASEADVDGATQWVRELALQLGFARLDANLLSVATSELAMNVVLHAGEGVISIRQTANLRGIEVECVDRGPGIEDLERARKDGYSTRPTGLGIGLGAVARAVDRFEIESAPGRGTRARIQHYRPPTDGVFDVSFLSDAALGQQACAALVLSRSFEGDKQLVAVIEGAGNGSQAHQVAPLVRRVMLGLKDPDLLEMVTAAHRTVADSSESHGFSLAGVLASRRDLRVVATGDVACSLFAPGATDCWARIEACPGLLGGSCLPEIEERVIPIRTATVTVVLATNGIDHCAWGDEPPAQSGAQAVALWAMAHRRRPTGDAVVAAMVVQA